MWRRLNFMLSPLFALAPATLTWSPKVALVMIAANVIAIGIGKATIQHPNEGAKLPSPALFGGLSHASLLATTSFGHVLGMGAIFAWPRPPRQPAADGLGPGGGRPGRPGKRPAPIASPKVHALQRVC